MRRDLLAPESLDGAGEQRGGPVTRKERELVIERLLARYDDVGAAIVGDDQTLCRLLNVMHRATADNAVDRYVHAYLGA